MHTHSGPLQHHGKITMELIFGGAGKELSSRHKYSMQERWKPSIYNSFLLCDIDES